MNSTGKVFQAPPTVSYQHQPPPPTLRAYKSCTQCTQCTQFTSKPTNTHMWNELVEALGMKGIDKSEVSRISKQLDEFVEEFKNRRLEGEYPYLWLDATFPKVREGGRVCSMALVIAVGVNQQGEREILGFDVGMSEDGAFWEEFLRRLVARGLKGVRLVISDAHEGLKAANKEDFNGKCMAKMPCTFYEKRIKPGTKHYQGMVSSIIRTIFAQNDQESAREQLRHVVDELKNRFPKAMKILEEAEEEILAYMAFPREHWAQIHSTNPLERLNREIRRRTDVVCIFPNREAVIRLVGAMLMEQNDEWKVGRRYFSLESMSKITSINEFTLTPVALLHK